MTTAINKAIAKSVQADNELKNAIAAAQERAAEVYSKGRKTLVDQIPIEKWLEWDATDELAIVADSDGLDEDDDDNDGCIDAVAA